VLYGIAPEVISAGMGRRTTMRKLVKIGVLLALGVGAVCAVAASQLSPEAKSINLQNRCAEVTKGSRSPGAFKDCLLGSR
jgi:hypothetical protein